MLVAFYPSWFYYAAFGAFAYILSLRCRTLPNALRVTFPARCPSLPTPFRHAARHRELMRDTHHTWLPFTSVVSRALCITHHYHCHRAAAGPAARMNWFTALLEPAVPVHYARYCANTAAACRHHMALPSYALRAAVHPVPQQRAPGTPPTRRRQHTRLRRPCKDAPYPADILDGHRYTCKKRFLPAWLAWFHLPLDRLQFRCRWRAFYALVSPVYTYLLNTCLPPPSC